MDNDKGVSVEDIYDWVNLYLNCSKYWPMKLGKETFYGKIFMADFKEYLDKATHAILPAPLKALDEEAIIISFEKFLEPHTCGWKIKQTYIDNGEYFKLWIKGLCAKFGTSGERFDKEKLIKLSVDFEGIEPLDKFDVTGFINKICQHFSSPQMPSVNWPERKDAYDNNLNCLCDGSGKDVNGFCKCDFSIVEGYNQAIEDCIKAYNEARKY